MKSKFQSELEVIGKRRLLSIMMLEAADLSTNGENFEHQHFIKIWIKASTNTNESRNELRERLNEFKERYESAGVQCKILGEMEIVALCNLFGNARQMPYDTMNPNTLYENIPQIRD